MISFASDYIEGAHPRILERLMETNMEQLPGYGTDPYCESAAEKIRKACQCPDAQVRFLAGGTQTNQVVIASMLKPYEGVVAAVTGHVSAHEAGAIEASGHKVLTIPGYEGKIRAKDLEKDLETFYGDENHEHMVFPGMVYLSYPTEYGTIYSKEELTDIYRICRKYDIPLFIDGARLGYGLMSYQADLTLSDLASLCDVFYIGGTKVGALCGEAVVFTRGNMPDHFTALVKQRGALMAKGRLLGIQFDELFTDDLYWKISRHAIDMAMELKQIFREKGYALYLDSPTNQQFVVLDDQKRKELESQVAFSFWEKPDEKHTVVRFATSWATGRENLEMLKNML